MRRYNSIVEIKSEESFRERNALNRENYRKLRGPYGFSRDEELECCCQKANGNLCEKRHRKGWVVELQDGTTTVIGGTCAAEKYDAESHISRDITLATNEIARQDQILRLTDLLRERDKRLAEIEVAKRELLEIKRSMLDYFAKLGPSAAGALTDMSRTGGATIRVLGVVPAERDQDGEVIRDRKEISINVGSVIGVAACNLSRINASLDDLREIEKAYKLAGADPERAFKAKEIKALNAALADQGRVMEAVEEWKRQFDRFERNDFRILAFVAADISQRIRIAQFGLGLAGSSNTRESAKRFLHEREAVMKQAHGVKQIRIR